MTDKKTPNGGFILIVEDDRGANNLEAMQLKELGLEIRSAYSARETIDILKNARPELMLLDYSLPDMSALRLLEELKRNNIQPPPFIVITGQGDEKMAVAIMKAGAQDYLVKDAGLLDSLPACAKKALLNAGLRAELERTKLQAEEERDKYKQLFNSVNDAILVHGVGPDGAPTNFIDVNEAACTRLGYTRDELLRIGPVQLDAGDMAEQRKTAMRALQRDGKAIFEMVHLTKDGRRIPVEVSSRVFEDGEKIVLSLARDISVRKEAEKELLDSKERFSALFDKAPLGYQSLDEEGKFLEVNEAWLGMLGYAREEVMGKWFGDFLAPEIVDAFRKRFLLFKAQGKIHSEFWMLRKDGDRRYIAFEGRIGYKPDGSFGQTHCVLQDMTSTKQAEDALKESEARYRALFDMAGDGIFMAAADGSSFIVNQSFAAMHGYGSPGEMAHLRLTELDTPKTSPLVPERLRRVLAGETLTFEVEHFHKDGHSFQLSVTANIILVKGKTYILAVHRYLSGSRPPNNKPGPVPK